MRRALVFVILAAACSKPLVLPPAPPTEPAAPPRAQTPPESDPDRFQMPRDPRGGYLTPSDPPRHEPTDPPPIEREPPPPLGFEDTDPEAPPVDPPPLRCKRHEIEVERCITGGMPRRGPDGRLVARTSCSTRCETKPPTHGRCRKIDARHYQCKSFAP